MSHVSINQKIIFQLNATEYEQVNRILEHLGHLDDKMMKKFRICLIETNQEDILHILDSEDDTGEGKSYEQTSSQYKVYKYNKISSCANH